jgi:hypothetical protein
MTKYGLPFGAALIACLGLAAARAYAAPDACKALKGQRIIASDIALPTKGAVTVSASHIFQQQVGFCKVMGRIAPVDLRADPIRFELNLPDSWNGKAVQFGGGAFDGYLHESDGLGPTVVGEKNKPGPLARGYATFGSDSGHHHRYLFLPDALNALSAKFALNDEQRKNFASDSLKKTHDVAVALLKVRYSSAPRRMYFIGGSTGGREAMMVVDRWPEDYDGVMAAYAAWNQIESDLQFIRVSQAMYSKNGWLPRTKTKLLRYAVLLACDAQDGLEDGIVSNPSACKFDPATLRCSDGKDHSGCLSDGQETTVSAFASVSTSDFTVQNGINSEPGYNVLRGADLVGSTGLFHHAFHPPIPLLNSFYYVVGDGVLRFFLTDDEHFDSLTFDVKTGGPGGRWIPGILQQSAQDDGSLADLTPFEHRGGKLLLVHGTADSTIPTDASTMLYQRIVGAMGQSRVDSFARLYLIPGYGHGRGAYDAGFDTVGVLDAWADGGTSPSGLVVFDQNKGSMRSRPLCEWPRWPQYLGGDPTAASSFVCANGDQAK